MNIFKKTTINALVASTLAMGLLASSPVIAGEIRLAHDKGFWSEQLQVVGDASHDATGVRIVESPYATAEQYKAFIQASIAGGETPEMFTWWTGATFSELVATGQIASLNDVWDEMVASGNYDASAADLFRVDGNIYAVPLLLARWVMIYDVSLFEELSISEPTTWAELITAADTLKAAGHTPFNASVHEGWRGFIWFQELMIRSNPDAYAGLHDGSVAYDSEAVRKVFEIWVDMYEKGYFTDPRTTSEIEDFAGGSAGMYLKGEWVVGILDANGMPSSDIGAFIVPNMDPDLPPSVIVEGGPIVIAADAKDNADVMKALNYWVSVEGSSAWSEASGNYAGNKNATAPNPIVSKISQDMGENGTIGIMRWWEATPADLQGELVAELNSFMLDPTMENAEGVMARMQALNADYWANQ